ncbi:MAG TPA: 2-C-methyl-D-erythritol 4-phosphate cytidylyltransferase [Oligoflexia bacterium]|nr:2-C-methyl-D-erythritol 4-phosphate cytidylyltransferase [Oligoflexia bacterium]HMR25211.1 2-C-methyl-D-erythritol 4-phosphate cytidylyltransferase [Oligoflexia bacterium]
MSIAKHKLSVVIPAGGSGTRMQLGQAKQYLKINGKMVLEYTLQAFESHAWVDEIILVLPEEDLASKPVSFWRDLGFLKVKHCVAGGQSRQESVWQGLQQTNLNNNYVLIHDAARCLFNSEDLSEAIQVCDDADGVIYASPLSDSIKHVELRRIKESVDRSKLWAMQTPQIFKRSFITQAYEKAIRDQFFATDDAQVAEYKQGLVKVFPSRHINLKLTQAADVALFAALLQLKERQDV